MSVLKEQHDDVETVPLKKDSEINVNNTFYKKICYFKSNITVEPALFGGILASTLSKISMQNLNLDKVCRVSKNYGDEICDALIDKTMNSTEYEVEIQQIVSAIVTWTSIVQTVIPLILLMFVGAWSDRTGNRKICLLLPIFGEILLNISNILSTIFFDAVSVEVTMILESFLPAITGSWLLMLLGGFSYICDITSLESRTFRVGLVASCVGAGIPLGMSLSGILLKFTGYYGVFSIAASLNVVSLLYGYYNLSSITGKSQKKSVTIADLIKMQKETVDVVFKKREGNVRMKIILTLIVGALVFAYDHGETLVTYLFLRYRLNWDAFKYSIYSTYNVVLNTLGCLFALSLFSKYLGWHDSSLCIVASLSKLAGSIFIVFVRRDFHMFIVPIVQILHAPAYTAIRSMASKLVPVEDLGKINSLISLMETVGMLIFDPIYSSLYSATMERFSTAAFVFTGVMTVPVLMVLLRFFKQHRQESENKKYSRDGNTCEIQSQHLVELN